LLQELERDQQYVHGRVKMHERSESRNIVVIVVMQSESKLNLAQPRDNEMEKAEHGTNGYNGRALTTWSVHPTHLSQTRI